MSFEVTILNSENETRAQVQASCQVTLLTTFKKAKLNIDHVCDGHASCGTCKFRLLDGKVTPRTDLEQQMFDDRGMDENERLSCQTKPQSNLIIKI